MVGYAIPMVTSTKSIKNSSLMNRKPHRASRIKLPNDRDDASIAELLDRASWYRAHGNPKAAERICDEILALEPFNVQALNILGLIFQESGRHKPAVKALVKAVASDPLNAACHFNLANSYYALNRTEQAVAHFKKAIVLDDRPNNTEKLILQSPAIMTCIGRIEARWPMPVRGAELFEPPTLNTIASDLFLRCALETRPIGGVALERFLTSLRSAILDLTHSGAIDPTIVEVDLVNLAAALAQQCFINEFVYADSEREVQQSTSLRDALLQKLQEGSEIPSLLLAAVAGYFPLHSLPEARALLKQRWAGSIDDLLRVQLREPQEEAADRDAIASLTPIDDEVSLRVMRQYAENPYPRWSASAATMYLDGDDQRCSSIEAAGLRTAEEILIAGCGTGMHAIEVARNLRDSHILAIDISLPSLCFARRKSRELNVHNIEYAQADILSLPAIGRDFDRVEAVGVLHHLADPEAGWRVLLSLLKPNGVMRVGLYSELARRAIVEVREFIAERGYHPTKEDIRKCRQEIFREYGKRGWSSVVGGGDFYSLSGCRDMMFNVMEHTFTIPRVKAFLTDQRLSFLGFDLPRGIMEKFQSQFPGKTDPLDLDNWHAFEMENPQAFMQMYQFTVRKN